MNISLIDVDGHNYPNLALMKISAYHKMIGDSVEWYSPLLSNPDKIYASKIFNFSPEPYINPNHPEPERGGTGYSLTKKLPKEIDDMFPDYSIYPQYDFAVGFLTRGCIRNCPWCVVPKKEGQFYIYNDIQKIARKDTRRVFLMDNNFLASPIEFIKEQTDIMIKMKLKIDFNQALDARLVNEENAKILSRVKWDKYIRFSCDTWSSIEPVKKAVKLLRQTGYTKDFFIFFLAKEIDETHERINQITEIDERIMPFCMPFRNLENGIILNKELQRFANWCNKQAVRRTISWEEFSTKPSQWKQAENQDQMNLF